MGKIKPNTVLLLIIIIGAKTTKTLFLFLRGLKNLDLFIIK